MTIDHDALSRVLHSMEDPIVSIERASDALEIIAKDPAIDAVQRGALVFVADSLLELHKRLMTTYEETLGLMSSGNSQGPGPGPVAVPVVGRAE